MAEQIAAANAGRPSRLHSHAIGPAWLRSAFEMQDPLNDHSQEPRPASIVCPDRALYDATLANDLAAMKTIIDLAPEQVHFEENSGLTPLEAAIWMGSVEAARLLIAHGSDVNVKDPVGQSPLHVACNSGNFEKVVLLVENGADINAAKNDGYRPIHYALMASRKRIVQYLKSKGALLDRDEEVTKDALRLAKDWKWDV
jgi:hypothetical protein